MSSACAAVVSLEAVSKTYAIGQESIAVHALREVSLDLSRGESVAIMGASGSGKSTALNIIGTLEVPRVFRDGHPGAIYLHQGAQWEVAELDQNLKRVRVREVEADYYTEPRGDDNVEILEVLKRVDLGMSSGALAGSGPASR